MVKFWNIFTATILLSAFVNCKPNQLEFIRIEDILEKFQKNQLTAESLGFDLTECLYLDVGLKTEINKVFPSYLSQKNIDIDDFVINDKDKVDIELVHQYDSTEKLIINPDISLKKYLRKSFGIKNFENTIDKQIILFKNRAFVKFITDEGSIYALIFELLQPKKLRIEIAYIVVD